MGGGVRRQLWLQTWFHSTPPLPPGALVSSSVKWQQNILRCWGFTHYPRKSWEVGLRGIPTQTHRQTEEWAQPPRLGGEGVGDPQRRAVTYRRLPLSQTLRVHGQPVTLVPSMMGSSTGTWGPFSWRGRKLCAMQHHRGAPGGHTCCVCFKVL